MKQRIKQLTKRIIAQMLVCVLTLATLVESAPAEIDGMAAAVASVSYRTYVQTTGWQGWVLDGTLSGTVGKAKRLEGIQVKLAKKPYTGGVSYRTYVQKSGWQSWVSDSTFSGTKGKGMRLEALQIKLTGEMSKHYDIWYRVHAQRFGWLAWVKNGTASGTAGFGYRLEAVQIVLTAKGSNAPGNVKGIKSANKGGYVKPVDKYSYEVIPLLAPFNEFFYIKTDNSDPKSFSFRDKKSKYAESTGDIIPTYERFADVVYEDSSIGRVNGGYIAYGDGTDGGELSLVVIDSSGSEKVSSKTVKIQALKDDVDYIIDTYTVGKSSYFDKMSAAQSGLDSICLYSGAYVLGELKKDEENPYYFLSTSPHVDQDFYIQDPYYRTGSRPMLISSLYPYRLDSIGFPSELAAVSKRIDPAVTYKWSGSAHYLIDFTKDGVTKSYGGAGSGGGQGINEDQILYRYRFDNSSDDAYKSINMNTLKTRLNKYGTLKVDEDAGKTDDPLTWSALKKTVGKGTYVRLMLLTSIWGGTAIGYTYLYDNDVNEALYYGGNQVGYFHNAWFEGRYYNNWEYIYFGAEFEDTVNNVQPALIFKDFKLKVPQDGHYYRYYATIDEELDSSVYDESTGTWKGYTKFIYDADTKSWKAQQLNNLYYFEDNGRMHLVDDKDFVDGCTITMDEALNMNLDRNTNKEPDEFLIYDGTTVPGTKGNN